MLQFIDPPTAHAVTTTFTRTLAPGSCLVISVARADGEIAERFKQSYTAGSLQNHSPEQIEGFFAGTEFVPPGLVEARMWPDIAAAHAKPAGAGQLLAGVGRKP